MVCLVDIAFFRRDTDLYLWLRYLSLLGLLGRLQHPTLLVLLTPAVRRQALRLVDIQPHVDEQYHDAANRMNQGAPQRAELVGRCCWICCDVCKIADYPCFDQQDDRSKYREQE